MLTDKKVRRLKQSNTKKEKAVANNGWDINGDEKIYKATALMNVRIHIYN